MKLWFRKTPKCKQGHKLTEKNLYYHTKKKDGRTYQECRICNLQRSNARHAAKRHGSSK